MEFELLPKCRTLGIFLGTITAVLVALHSFTMACWKGLACGPLTGVVNQFGYLFDLNREQNIPTWFSTVLLFAVAQVAWVAARLERANGGQALPWWGLCWLFSYLSIDEAAELHYFWGVLSKAQPLSGSGQVGFAWVVPGLMLVAVIGLIYLRWVWRQPPRLRAFFITAGVVYVSGGLGMEIVGDFVADQTYFTFAFLAASTAEETLEMAGVIIMLLGVTEALRGMRRPAAMAR